jgi:hypothetical protein
VAEIEVCAFCGNDIPANEAAYVVNGRPACSICHRNSVRGRVLVPTSTPSGSIQVVSLFAKANASSSCTFVGWVFLALGLLGLVLSILGIVEAKIGPRSTSPEDLQIVLMQQEQDIVLFTFAAFASLFAIALGSLLTGVGRIARAFPR